MKTVANIAELIQRGIKNDAQAQQAVVDLMKRVESDPEFEQVMKDAAARVKEGRADSMDEDTVRLRQQVEDEVGGSTKPTEREAKLLRLLYEARVKLKELEGGEEGVRAGETGAQDARVPQGERGQEEGTQARGEGWSGQEGRRQGNRPQELQDRDRPVQSGQPKRKPQTSTKDEKARVR